MADKTKVFISWSGGYSKQVALTLRDWLQELFDNIRPFVSDRDIDPGARGTSVIERELSDTSFGVVVITQANQRAPWLNFEAGALSKEVGDSTNHVVPVLMDMDSSAELTGPISQFQAQKFDRAGMLRVVEGIAAVVGANTEAVRRRFDRSWADVHQQILAVPVEAPPDGAPTRRGVDEMVEETLTIVRSIESRFSYGAGGTPPPNLDTTPIRILTELEKALEKSGIECEVSYERSLLAETVRVGTPFDTTPADRKLIHVTLGSFKKRFPSYVFEYNEPPF